MLKLLRRSDGVLVIIAIIIVASISPPRAWGGEPVGCAADLNGDGQVASADLNLMLASFGSGAGGDIDGDGATDSADLNLILAGFGVTGCNSGGGGDCCAPHSSGGCDNVTCQDMVCALEPSCCSDAWVLDCVYYAVEYCRLCDGVFIGPCCEEHPAPGCDDPECTEIVCKIDPYCCDQMWDVLCLEEALRWCEVCEDV